MATIYGANSVSGYDVANSLRLNSGDSAQMNKTLGTATDVDKYTISMWVKRARLGHRQMMMRVIDPSSTGTYAFLEFQAGDKLASNDYDESGSIAKITNSTNFKDISAWYHIVLALDSTQGTASNRSKLYVNGTQITSFGTDSGGSQNQNLMGNTSGKNIYIGGDGGQDTRYCGLYMAEVCFIDGQQLTPTSFGEFDSDSPNIWKPIDVSGLTFGNNGFYLDFEDSGNLGNDVNGGTDLTEVNIAATDQSTDTCTNNFAVLANHSSDDLTLTEGRLKFENPSGGHRMVTSTIAPSQGKWYAEVKMTTEAQSTRVGVIDPAKVVYNTYIHNAGRGYAYKGNDGSSRFNDGTTDGSYGDTYTTGDIVGIAMDLDNHKLYFSKNGTFQNSGDPTSGSTGTGSAFDLATGVDYYIGASTQDQGTNPVIEFNFGSPSFAISSGNTDSAGYGNFEYSVPSGYYALNSKNLAKYG